MQGKATSVFFSTSLFARPLWAASGGCDRRGGKKGGKKRGYTRFLDVMSGQADPPPRKKKEQKRLISSLAKKEYVCSFQIQSNAVQSYILLIIVIFKTQNN